MTVTLDLRSIACALGGEVRGRQVLAPGPNHSRRDRSLSVRLSHQSPTGFIVTSFAGDPFDVCRDFVMQKLGMDPDAWRTRSRGRGDTRPAPAFTVPEHQGEADDEARIARAVAIWNEGRDPAGTAVERYLAGRGLALPERGIEVLRFHPRCPWKDDPAGPTIHVPAMVAAMRAVVGDRITAVHRTRLTDDGRKVDRKMLGPARGSAVKIDPDDEVAGALAVGEGIETTLAARQFGIRPAWAMTSTANLAKLPVLPGIEVLTLLAENDHASARAVEECGDRWFAAGRQVDTLTPTAGKDMNDALQRMRGAT